MNENKFVGPKGETFTDKYSKYFQDNNTIWKDTLQKASQYIDENDKLPSNSDKKFEYN